MNAASRERMRQRNLEECPGHSHSLGKALWGNLGHRSASLDTNSDEPLVICLACGAWASKEPVKLLAPCGKVRSHAGKLAISRALSGLYPNHATTGVVVTGIVVIKPHELQPAERAALEAVGSAQLPPSSGGDTDKDRPPGATDDCSVVGASHCWSRCCPAVNAVLQRVLARAAARAAGCDAD